VPVPRSVSCSWRKSQQGRYNYNVEKKKKKKKKIKGKLKENEWTENLFLSFFSSFFFFFLSFSLSLSFPIHLISLFFFKKKKKKKKKKTRLSERAPARQDAVAPSVGLVPSQQARPSWPGLQSLTQQSRTFNALVISVPGRF
jgi:hypothetical protein